MNGPREETDAEIEEKVQRMRVGDDVAEYLKAAKNGDIKKLEECLAKKPELLNQDEGSGRGALHFAAFENLKDVVDILVTKYKADVNKTDFDNYTPLFYAAKTGAHETAAILLKNGINVNHATGKGVTALHQAATHGDVKMMKLLIDNGAQINPPKVGEYNAILGSPLAWAVSGNQVEAVKFLLDNGADPNSRDSHHGIPLHVAAALGSKPIVEALIAKGSDVNASATDGSTPLHLATEAENLDIVELLLQAGANPKAADKEGNTPTTLALAKRNSKLVTLLETEASKMKAALKEADVAKMTPEEKKKKAEAYKNLGNQAFKNGNYLEAIAYYTEAINKLDPENHVLYSNRSACSFNLGRYKQALEDAEKCIQIDANWAKGYFRKAASLVQLKRYDEARETIEAGLKIDPENKELLKEKEQLEARLLAQQQQQQQQ